MATEKNHRRSFDFARGNLWSIDPDELCIIGGKRLPADQQGPLDTNDGETHELYDERVDDNLTDTFINSIDAHGVDTPILIVKLNDQAVVVDGRQRVRAARLVNARRASHGEPRIKIDCKLIRVSGAGLLAAMIAANEGRTDDGLFTKIEKLKRLLGRGVSEADAAVHFCVGVATVKGWLAFEDHATAQTKDAARKGRLHASAAAELAKITDPVKQNEKLGEMLSASAKVSTRAARDASRAARGKTVGVGDKKTQKRLLHVVQAASHPNVSEKTAAWWEGAEEMLKLVLGVDGTDARLKGKLEEALTLSKTEKKGPGRPAKVKETK
jgi:ParB family chromosome partitioning protein